VDALAFTAFYGLTQFRRAEFRALRGRLGAVNVAHQATDHERSSPPASSVVGSAP
jgi:hypothetical protein